MREAIWYTLMLTAKPSTFSQVLVFVHMGFVVVAVAVPKMDFPPSSSGTAQDPGQGPRTSLILKSGERLVPACPSPHHSSSFPQQKTLGIGTGNLTGLLSSIRVLGKEETKWLVTREEKATAKRAKQTQNKHGQRERATVDC